MFDLTGKIALVTGAASGIGEAIAKILSNAGAFVYVCDLNEADGSRVAAAIGAEKAKFLKLNFRAMSQGRLFQNNNLPQKARTKTYRSAVILSMKLEPKF